METVPCYRLRYQGRHTISFFNSGVLTGNVEVSFLILCCGNSPRTDFASHVSFLFTLTPSVGEGTNDVMFSLLHGIWMAYCCGDPEVETLSVPMKTATVPEHWPVGTRWNLLFTFIDECSFDKMTRDGLAVPKWSLFTDDRMRLGVSFVCVSGVFVSCTFCEVKHCFGCATVGWLTTCKQFARWLVTLPLIWSLTHCAELIYRRTSLAHSLNPARYLVATDGSIVMATPDCWRCMFRRCVTVNSKMSAFSNFENCELWKIQWIK